MAISKARKDELVAQYTDLLENSDAFFVTEYTGMSVKQMEDLRHKVREADGAFHITKNTLFQVALKQANLPVPNEMLEGQTAVGFALKEPSVMAKTLADFAKAEEEVFKIRGGVMSGDIISDADVTTLSKLPSMDELRGQILGVLQAPATKLARLIQTPTQQLVTVFNAYSEKTDAGEGAPA